MTEDKNYEPPKVWKWDAQNGGQWSKTNRPIAGATHKEKLVVGKHPLQLHSLATPNGQKVTIMLEELLELGISDAEYDAYTINIGKGDQFGSGFVAINPNSKIPALMDNSTAKPTRLFESGAILLYLAEKFGQLLPSEHKDRPECLSWLFWQMGSAPYLGGGFGHFYKYAPFPIEYCIDRFTMETKRQFDVLDKHLAKNKYMCGNEYTIADIAIFPWYGLVALDVVYEAADFLDTKSYKHVMRWAKAIAKRPAVIRGRMVNKTWGPEDEQLAERHDASDFDGKAIGKKGKTTKTTAAMKPTTPSNENTTYEKKAVIMKKVTSKKKMSSKIGATAKQNASIKKEVAAKKKALAKEKAAAKKDVAATKKALAKDKALAKKEVAKHKKALAKEKVAAKKEAVAKKKALIKEKAAAKKQAVAKKKAIAKEKAIAKKQAVAKKKAIAKEKASAKKEAAAKKKALAKQKASAKKQAAGKKKASSKKKATGKKKASSKIEATGKKKASSKKKATGKKKASSKKKAAGKKKASSKKKAAGKKKASSKKKAAVK